MNAMKKMLVVLAAAMMLGFASNASATCTAVGKITRAYAYTVGTSDIAYYYVNPSHLGVPVSYVHYFLVNKDRNSDMLAAAASDFRNVQITGSATACPTTGAYRYGGVAMYNYVFPAR